MRSINALPAARAALLVLAALAAAASLAADAPAGAVIVNRKDIKWLDGPRELPKGARMAVLYGDPSKPGPFVLRVSAPPGYRVPPHWHSQAESLTVISGTLHVGDDADDAHPIRAGGFHYLPAKMRHYVFTKRTTVVQIQGEGPFDIHYVDPADDPRRPDAEKE